MKINIDIDCTPEEARALIGLPDVSEAHAEMMKQVQARMTEYLASADPETVAKAWMPTGVEAWQNMQKAFFDQFSGAKPDEKPGD